MAEGISEDGANAALDGLVNTYGYVQLHVGAPGAAGTANVAGETTRKYSNWDSATGGTIVTSNDLLWLSVAATEDYTHFTLWDTDVGGIFGASGTITAVPVTAGDDVTLAAGDLELAFTTFAS